MDRMYLPLKKRDAGSSDVASAVISTGQRDRDGDELDPRGCDYADYLKNPVILLNHDPRAPIGRCLSIEPQADGIAARWRWAQGVEPAETAHRLWDQQVLGATSVGFIPTEKTPLAGGGWRFSKWTLLEFSVCSIPSNPSALAIRGLNVHSAHGEALLDRVARRLHEAGLFDPTAAQLGALFAHEEAVLLSEKVRESAARTGSPVATLYGGVKHPALVAGLARAFHTGARRGL